MNDTLLRRFVDRLWVASLAVLLVALSAGLAYVAHLTQATSQQLGKSSPSVFPLIALSVLFAIAGVGMFRYAWRRDVDAA